MKKQRAKDRHLYSYMDTLVDDIAAAGSSDTPVVCTSLPASQKLITLSLTPKLISSASFFTFKYS